MTKIRQYVCFIMAVTILCSTVSPHSVYADEIPSESESIEQLEESAESESVTEAETEIESETASETDTELENDGIYNDAEYIDDLMINDIAVYSNSRPTGDGRETSGGSLSSGGHRPTRTSGGHSVSGNTTASQTINNIVVNFSTDLRNDIEDIANILDYVQNKLVSINNNLCDAIGYLYDISMAVERVSSSVSTCANWLAKCYEKVTDILSAILDNNVTVASMDITVSDLKKTVGSISTTLTSALKDTSGTWIAQQVYYLRNSVDSILLYVKASNTIISNALKNESGVWLIEYAEQTFTHVYQLYTNFNSAFLVGDKWIGSYVLLINNNLHDLYSNIKEYLPSVDTSLSSISYFTSRAVAALSDGNGIILNTVRDIKKLLSESNSKFDKLITAVKELNQKVVVIDNSDRTKSDDEEENSSLFDLVTMVMYSVFILASLLDLLLLLLEYVVLMFQIPAVPALMNENVLLGWNYANAICIPGTEFSIVSFLRLLMYITVVFSAVKVIKNAIDNGSIGVI